MAQINVIGTRGGRSIDLDLPEVNPHVLHEVVTWQLAGRRRGTASTKTGSGGEGSEDDAKNVT